MNVSLAQGFQADELYQSAEIRKTSEVLLISSNFISTILPTSLVHVPLRLNSNCSTIQDQQRKMVNSRKQSIVEAAEAHFDKNTLILIVNVVILTVLISLLYMVATSAMAASGGPHNEN